MSRDTLFQSLATPHQEEEFMDFPMVLWFRIHLPMQGTRVPSLVRELRSHKLQSAPKKEKKGDVYSYLQPLKQGEPLSLPSLMEEGGGVPSDPEASS